MSNRFAEQKIRERFLKMRHSDPEMSAVLRLVNLEYNDRYEDAVFETTYFEYFGNPESRWDDSYPDASYCGLAGIHDIFSIRDIVSSVINSFSNSASDGGVWIGQQMLPTPKTSIGPKDRERLSQFFHGGVLEERIHQFQMVITNESLSFNWPAFTGLLIQQLGSIDNLRILQQNASDTVDNLLLYSPFWIRRPETWNGQGGVAGLVEHLLVNCEVPESLYIAWSIEQFGSKFLAWFILIGQGGSLKRAAKNMGWVISGRLQASITAARSRVAEVGFELSPLGFLIFTEVVRLGGSTKLFRSIASNPAFVIDPTDSSVTREFRSFWESSIRWLAINGGDLTEAEVSIVLSWALHEHTEAYRDSAVSGLLFNWNGRTVRSVLSSSRDYLEKVSVSKGNFSWGKRNFSWNWMPEPDRHWTFVELVSALDLFNEGQAMNHCVTMYSDRCACGHSSIVSMRLNNKRIATIEVNPMTLNIIQARGPCNRELTDDENSVVWKWREMHLNLRRI